MSNNCANCAKLEAEVARLGRDCLTGLARRGIFDSALQTEFARCRRFGRRLGVVLVDVDRFKKVNDTFGHPAGDRVLAGVAHLVASCARECDVVARLGGDEFAVLLDDAHAIREVAERIRRLVDQRGRSDSSVRLTVSAGFATQRGTDRDGRAILARADAALYRAKARGRNCVEGG